MANLGVRKRLKENNLFLWQVGAAAGVIEMTVIRWLRTPLTAEHRARIEKAIEDCLKERTAAASGTEAV